MTLKHFKIGTIVFLIPIFLIAQQTKVFAEENSSPQPETKTVELKGGDRAPWDGLLFSHLAAARMKVYIETQQKLQTIEIEKLRAELKLEYETDLNRLKITDEHTISNLESELDFKEQLLDDMQEQLDRNQSFFKSYDFGLLAGITGTLAVVLVTGYALGRIK